MTDADENELEFNLQGLKVEVSATHMKARGDRWMGGGDVAGAERHEMSSVSVSPPIVVVPLAFLQRNKGGLAEVVEWNGVGELSGDF